MLDQLSDMDLKLRAKQAAQPDDDEGSIRHLSPEDLRAYANGPLTPARLTYCQAHLDSCEECRDELEDLRTFKSDLSTFPRPEPNLGMPGRRKQRRGLKPFQATAIAVGFVVGIAAVFWWKRESPRANTPLVAAAAAPAPTPTPALSMQTRDTRVADEVAALPDDVRSAVSDAIQHGKLQLPGNVSQSSGHEPTFPGATVDGKGFALLSPLGTAIAETRPELHWQPLTGAVRYSVVIVDVGLHPVRRSHALRDTVWRPRRALRPGRTYLWQVTATLRGGSKVVASNPSPSGALLRIVPLKLAREMQDFRKTHEDAHLVLGAMYAQAGMLTESANELKKVPPVDSSYNTAQKLLASVSPHQSQ